MIVDVKLESLLLEVPIHVHVGEHTWTPLAIMFITLRCRAIPVHLGTLRLSRGETKILGVVDAIGDQLHQLGNEDTRLAHSACYMWCVNIQCATCSVPHAVCDMHMCMLNVADTMLQTECHMCM